MVPNFESDLFKYQGEFKKLSLQKHGSKMCYWVNCAMCKATQNVVPEPPIYRPILFNNHRGLYFCFRCGNCGEYYIIYRASILSSNYYSVITMSEEAETFLHKVNEPEYYV